MTMTTEALIESAPQFAATTCWRYDSNQSEAIEPSGKDNSQLAQGVALALSPLERAWIRC